MVERTFRSILVGVMRVRWITIAVTLGCFVLSLLALPYVPRQFFPASDRPELVVDLTLPQNASIFASDAVAAKLDGMLKGDPDVASWSTYVGRGAIRFYLPLDVQLANDFFSQVVIIAKDVAARDRLHAKLEKELAEQTPERRRPRVASRARAARRMAGEIQGQRTRHLAGARDRSEAWADHGRGPQSETGQFRLDRALPRGPHQDRSGSGAACGTEFASPRRSAEHGDDGNAGDAGARRHLSRQRRRAGERRAARLALDAALASAAASQRAHGAAEPGRDRSISIRNFLSSGGATAFRP